MNSGPTVLVEWADAQADNDWRTEKEIRERAARSGALSNFSVGVLLVDEPGYVVLAGSWTPGVDGEAQYDQTMQIPRANIRSQVRLEARLCAPVAS